jgi:hypothetical protein
MPLTTIAHKPSSRLIDPLPKTLDNILLLGLEDLLTAEADPRYRIEMDAWHTPSEDGRVCVIGLAGAVMAGALECSPLIDAYPDYWWNGIGYKLFALHHLRIGAVRDAAESMRFANGQRHDYVERAEAFAAKNKEVCAIPKYTPHTRDKFHPAMRKLAQVLKEANL